MAMFKKRISEESSASESQWSSEQIQASASVTKLGEFGGKTQGSFDDDVVTTSIHWVSFEDLPDKDDKDATVGDTQLKWPSWKKGAAKFSKALSSPSTLREKPEPELTGRISSICRPLSAYGSVRNMDRGIVTATVGYQTDGSFVEEAEQHISSTDVTFHNDSIDSGHEGNFVRFS
ncbi:PREDICTED: uncharacterized protein LOC109465988 [Branchiostoma belcheri]|uniref:Uncharacterized protein LOC109465988 n=1 Tax=Branchiostoma belcheri TaxID=7741 RepID=A0A6P4Y9R6_BRABE|nr:PREDICTED: uncharacterized protein LOC109465988 [Branchiostoma belcheri]